METSEKGLTMSWIRKLKTLRACEEAVSWAEAYPDPQTMWNACERGDWMLWLVGKTRGDDRHKLVLAACACARLALMHVEKGEDRPRLAIETAEKWARGEDGVTLADVRKAADAAYAADSAAAAAAYDAAAAAAADYAAADDAANDTAADYAAAAAADYAAAAAAAYDAAAAYAAAAADYAAAAAAADYAAAAYDDAAAAYAAAKKRTLKKCAELVRGFYPEVPL
jgi:hypothetical protein